MNKDTLHTNPNFVSVLVAVMLVFVLCSCSIEDKTAEHEGNKVALQTLTGILVLDWVDTPFLASRMTLIASAIPLYSSVLETKKNPLKKHRHCKTQDRMVGEIVVPYKTAMKRMFSSLEALEDWDMVTKEKKIILESF